ncbi:ABC transporter ATP-binding protein [Rodentibacter caecimuris]|uniref:Iron ABC transporter ATP-binding protein n=1 Tax=Rodentibacter caecimuris TaxID=1796644 RepID=A0ABX3L0T3_9PAST|nr:iron ABC transporter ATP-binding protein [Rodentibacter heylii]
MSIEIRNITKSYGAKTVVDDVSLVIPKGKITSFIGPNGAGKSTVLSIMSRLLSADKGEVYLNNKLLCNQKSTDIAKQLAILRQSNHMNLRLAVEDLVSFGRFPYSKGNLTEVDRTFVDKAMCYLNLDNLRNVYLDQLSGGQRQRAYIAMVLAQDTDYILLDEPLNNLDMKHSVQIMQVLYKLATECGKTVVIVIHDINFASCYSDYIIAMKEGKLASEGKVGDIMRADVLRDIYEMDIPIQDIQDHKIAVYFR